MDRYLTVEIPCHPEVKHYLMQELPDREGRATLTRESAVGKVIIESMAGKKLYVYKRRDWPEYRSRMVIAVPISLMKDGKACLPQSGVRYINSFVRNMVQEHLFTYLRISLLIDPGLNIRTAVMTWMTAMGMSEDIKSLDTYVRTFRDWRKRKYPNLTRSIGRPRKLSENSSYLSERC